MSKYTVSLDVDERQLSDETSADEGVSQEASSPEAQTCPSHAVRTLCRHAVQLHVQPPARLQNRLCILTC